MPPDLRLPYADQYTTAIPPQALPSVSKFLGGVGNIRFFQGGLPCRHQWLLPQGEFATGATNSLTYGLRLSTVDMKYAIQYILGYAKSVGGVGFDRVIPIMDPDGFGMVATKVAIRAYESPSGKLTLEIPPGTDPNDQDGPNNKAPDGTIYNNTRVAFFDGTFPLSTDKFLRVASLYKYVVLSVTFEHVLYLTTDNDLIDEGSGSFGERDRFTVWNYIAGIEYVGLDSNTLVWLDNDGGAQPVVGTTVGKGAGFVRATGELKGNWYGIPGDAAAVLIQKWAGLGPFALRTDASGNYIRGPISGRINQAPFSVDITNFNSVITFPLQTLLWQPPKIIPVNNVLGFRTYNVELSLTHRPETWNKFLYWPRGKYFPVGYATQNPDPTTKLIGPPYRDVYRTANFEDAFVPF